MAEASSGTERLDKRFAGGLAWTAGVKWLTQLVTWSSVFFLARLLTPEDYGIGAMASSLLLISNVMAEFGVGTAVLHMPELSKKALAQFHAFSCLLCLAFFALACMVSPLVASFYHSDKILFFMANNIVLLITGFQSIPNALVARDMDYRRLAIAEASHFLVQAVVSVSLAWLGWGYWSLLCGSVAGKTTATVLVSTWKPVGFAWPRWEDIRAPFQLGRQSAIGRIAWSLYIQSDGIIIGRLMGERARGIYGMALDLSSAPAEKISMLLMRTSGPLFANVKDDLALVRRYTVILAELISLTVTPLMAGLAMVAPIVLSALWEQKWIAAATPVRWLAVYQIVRTMNMLCEQILTSQKRAGFTMRTSLMACCVMPIAFLFGAKWFGLEGVAGAWLAIAPLSSIPLIWMVLRVSGLPFGEYLSALLPAGISTGVMCLAVYWVSNWTSQQHFADRSTLGILIATGAVVYLATAFGLFGRRIARYLRFLKGLRGGGTAATA